MKTLLACLPIALLAACQGGVVDGADADGTWTRTIVRGNGPGQPPTVTEETFPAGSVAVDSVDSGCANADARLWSGSNFTGSEICFSGVDDIDLSQYYFVTSCSLRRFCTFQSWSKSVRSFKTGDVFGALYLPPPLQTLPPQFQCLTYLPPHSQIAKPDSCMPQATRFDNGLDPNNI
jgi:hypothetical protein